MSTNFCAAKHVAYANFVAKALKNPHLANRKFRFLRTFTPHYQIALAFCRDYKKLGSKARVRRFRDKLAAQKCARMEVVIGADVIETARAMAKRKGWPMWQVVQEALEAYTVVTGNVAHD